MLHGPDEETEVARARQIHSQIVGSDPTNRIKGLEKED